jgi:TPR repeat protein
MYQEGRGTPKDEAKAVGLYRKAADAGFLDALYALGNCFANGWGVSEDPGEALRWYCQAWRKGHPRAAEVLGENPALRCQGR